MKAPSFRVLLAIGAGAFGLLVWALLPQGIVALNDDFAYLRSVVGTLQLGRPWTDDWLEPWSAGLSVLSAMLFKGTGSFYFATYGLLAVLAAISFLLVGRLLAARGLPAGRTLLLAALGLTFPTLLWKQVQFTGMALYLPCLLGALWAAENRRWGAFLLAWALALATRQSALGWGVLPLVAIMEDWRREGTLAPRTWLAPAWAAVLGGGLYLGLSGFMNKTVAQRAVTDRMWENWNPAQAGTALMVGAVVLLLAAGWGVWAQWNREGAAGAGRPRSRYATIALLTVGALLLLVNVRDQVAFEYETFNSVWGRLSLKAAVVLGVVGLAFGRFSWRLLPLAGALAATAVLSLRAVIWDYYLVDIGVLGFFAVQPVAQTMATGRPWPRRLGWTVAAMLALFHLAALVQVKGTLDRTHALFDLGSRALEEGKLPPNHASFLPFGLMAWYYFPLYLQHDGKNGADLADFGCYLEQDTVLIAWRYSKPLRGLPGHDGGLPEDRTRVIVGGKFNYCWLYGVEVLLLPAPAESVRAAKRPYPSGYRLPVFPRDDAGWRALIAGESVRAVP